MSCGGFVYLQTAAKHIAIGNSYEYLCTHISSNTIHTVIAATFLPLKYSLLFFVICTPLRQQYDDSRNSAYPWTEWTSKLKSMRIGKQVDVLLLFSMILSCKYFYNALLCKNLLKNLIAMYIKHSVVAAIYIFVEVNHLMLYFNF